MVAATVPKLSAAVLIHYTEGQAFALDFRELRGTYLPRAIRAGAQLTLPKVRAVVELLSKRLGEVWDSEEIRSALSFVASIECTDGQSRRPAEVYYASDSLKSLLGTAASGAAIRSAHRESVGDLYC
jgi:hypothetical protein